MKKETRTTRLLSKKQSQKVVTLGMVITLFAPLLLAPIANAEEVQTEEVTTEVVSAQEASEEIQATGTQVPETTIAEEATQIVPEEIVTEAPLPEATNEDPIISDDNTPAEAVDSSVAENETVETAISTAKETTLPVVAETTEEVEESSSPNPTVIAEYQGVIDGLAADIDELVTLGATATQVQGLRNGIGNLQYQLNEYSEGWQTKEEMDTLFVPWVSEMRAEIAKIKASLNDISVTGVSLSALPELNVGETYALVATISPTNATNKDVSFSSSNPSIATVDANGTVTAVSAGSYSITVTTTDGGYTATVNGTVKEAPVNPEVPVTGITISKSETSLKVGDSETLTATITPDNATNKKVSWSSSDESVATVVDGKVTAKAKGTTTITVTSEDGGKTATCVVAVTEEVIPPVEKLDLDALKAAIAAANPLKEADYTTESWKPFAEAKVNAEAILAKAEAQNAKAALTQDTVDAATKALTDTQSKLVKKTTSGSNGNNSSGNNAGNNTGDNGSNSSNSGNNSGTGTNSVDSTNNTNAGNKSGNQANGNTVSTDTNPSSNKDGRIGNTAAKENTLPQAGEIQAPATTLLGIILVGIASIGTFLFKRKHSH